MLSLDYKNTVDKAHTDHFHEGLLLPTDLLMTPPAAVAGRPSLPEE